MFHVKPIYCRVFPVPGDNPARAVAGAMGWGWEATLAGSEVCETGGPSGLEWIEHLGSCGPQEMYDGYAKRVAAIRSSATRCP